MTIIESGIVTKPQKMLNPFGKKTLIFREDGTHIPTCKGLFHLPETKSIIGSANSRPKERSQVIEQSSIYEKIFPLVMRGLAIWEILRITEPTFNRKQIRNAVYRKRPEWRMPPENYFNPEKESIRRSRGTANALQKRLNKQSLMDRRNAIENEKKSIIFARELWKEGLITKDTSVWQELGRLYQLHNRPLPADSFEKLRLEVFLTAVLNAELDFDPTLLNKYRKLVNQFPYAGFTSKLVSHEQFIRNRVCKIWLWDGEDEVGLYVDTPYGKKRQLLVGSEGENEKLEFLTSKLLRNRKASRQRIESCKTIVDRHRDLQDLIPDKF